MNTIYAHELAGFKKDSQRSLSEYRTRQFFNSWKASVIVFFVMPFYMAGNLSFGKKISLLAAVSMVAVTLAPITFA